MNAVVIEEYGDVDVLNVVDRPTPEIGPHDVLLDTKAAALNRADVLQRKGQYPPPDDAPEDIPGLECAGVVRETGPRVRDVEPGQRVFALLPGGGYAKQVVTPASMVMTMPETLSFQQAAAIPEAFFTAYDGLIKQCGVGLGDRVVIHAAGSGVGTAAVQLVREAGASWIAGTASAPKLEIAHELGMDHGIDYRRESFRDVVLDQTDDQGVDAILDLVGSDYFELNLDCLCTLGRLLLVGDLSGSRAEIDLLQAKKQRIRILGTALRSRPLHEKVELTEEFGTRVLPLFEQERLRPVIDTVFSYRDAPAAHRYMEEDRNRGKIVLDFRS